MNAPSPAPTEPPPQRTIEELKIETQARADRNAYPLIGLDPGDVREALANISSLDRDEWGRAWIALGDRYMEAACKATDRGEADRDFLRAWRLYSFGRWPSPNSPAKALAYRKSLEAFARHAELLDTPLEVVRIPSADGEIVGCMQLPKGVRPAPLVLAISGLDSRKEELAERFGALLAHGIGYIALDSPGTGEAPVKASASAERIYSRALDHLIARPDIDARRIAVFGGSFGGHWSTKLAVTERERVLAVVAQSPGIHEAFQPTHVRRTMTNKEYLFDLLPAAMTTFDGVTTLDQLIEHRGRLSLATQGLLDRPMAPMLVIAGVLDTQTPIADIELLLRSGDAPKDAWINPKGGHMGREARGWTDPVIFREVTLPWLVRKLQPAGRT